MKRKNKIKNRRLLPDILTLGRQVIRFIFSRYFITLAIILVELFLIEHLLYAIAENLLITTAVVFILYAVGFIHLINRDTSPEYKLTWLVVIAIPIAGVVLYFLFFERRLSKREAELISRYTDNELLSREPSAEISAASSHYGKVRALLRDDPMALAYSNTGARFFSSGEEYFSSLIEDLRWRRNLFFLNILLSKRERCGREYTRCFPRRPPLA